MHRRSVRAAVVAFGAAAMLTAAPQAQATHSAHDNTNPNSGCSSSAFTAKSAGLNNSSGNYGIIELRYSSTCRTVWARVTSTYGVACVPGDDGCADAEVHRNSDNRKLYCTSLPGTKTCYTYQLNDAGVTSHAHGHVTTGPLDAYGTTGSY